MGLLNSIRRLRGENRRSSQKGAKAGAARFQRTCRIEEIEPRVMLSASTAINAPNPIHVGVTYLEQPSPDGSVPDQFQVSFNGGDAGTTLTKLVINTDISGSGTYLNNPFFNTQTGAPGVSTPSAPQIVSGGVGGSIPNVTEGSTQLVILPTSFQAGGLLTFTVGMNDDNQAAGDGVDPQVDANEFQGSTFVATLLTPQGQTLTVSGTFKTNYNLTPTGLNLPLTADPSPAYADAAVGTLPTVSGYVYNDLNGNGQVDTGEGIAGATLTLLQLDPSSGQYVSTGQTTVSASDGSYAFNDLQPGVSYKVVDTPPSPYLSLAAQPGSINGVTQAGETIDAVNQLGNITLPSGDNSMTDADSVQNNFDVVAAATVSGNVYQDNNVDNKFDAGDTGIGNVTVTLYQLNTSASQYVQVGQPTVTDASGAYSFTNLMPGTYRVVDTQPAGYLAEGAQAGTDGGNSDGVVDNVNQISTIVVQQGDSSIQNNFGEVVPSSISGLVCIDANGNGRYDPGETTPAGVTVYLLNSQGQMIQSTQTDSQGNYSFTNLMPGTYSVQEQPYSNYFQEDSLAGTAGGTTLQPNETDQIQLLPTGTNGQHYDFCLQAPASISGIMFVDANRNQVYDSGDTLVSGATVYLLDAQGNTVSYTTTDANGAYSFTGLKPGTYSVKEQDPAVNSYLISTNVVGTVAGATDGALAPPDEISTVALGSGAAGVSYNFTLVAPAQISGYVYVDVNTDNQFDAGDTPLSGVVVSLLDANGQPTGATATTDASGFYSFTNLTPGTYGVAEGHVSGGYTPGAITAGTAGGTVNTGADQINGVSLGSAANGQNYDFGHVRPSAPPVIPPPTPTPTPTNPTLPPYYAHVVPPATPFGAASPLGGPSPLPWALAPATNWATPATYVAGSDIALPGGQPEDFTWHLSIVNGGQPRGADEGTQLLSTDATPQFNPANWSATDMQQSEWVLANSDGAPTQRYVFGIRGARPVTGDWDGSGRTKIGLYLNGQWYLDLNGNGVWDKDDLWASLGGDTDLPLTGDWDGDGKTDIGVFGRAWAGDDRPLAREPGQPHPENQPGRSAPKNIPPETSEAASQVRSLKRSAEGRVRADVIDHVFRYGARGDIPVAGDWKGSGLSTIGVFREGTWYLDMDGDGKWSPGDLAVRFGQPGDIPLVGDWTGDGVKKLGIYRNGTFYLDVQNKKVLDGTAKVVRLGGPGDVPVVGDWNGDGVDKVGVYRDGQVTPPQAFQSAPGAQPLAR